MLMQVKGKACFQSCLLKGLQVDVRSLGRPREGPEGGLMGP